MILNADNMVVYKYQAIDTMISRANSRVCLYVSQFLYYKDVYEYI